MADAVMSTYTGEILARDLGLFPSDYGIYTVKTGVTTMQPGMFVTTFGETGTDVDILADGDEYATGIVLKRLKRAYNSDGEIVDTVDTALAAGDEIVVLHLTGGRAIVYAWLTGLDTTAARGTLRRGAEVFIPESGITALAITNPTIGAGMALVKGTLDLSAGFTQSLVQIAQLLEDAVIADSTAGVVGIIVKVAI